MAPIMVNSVWITIVAPSIGLVITATMHSGIKRKRYRISPRLCLSYTGRPLNLERFSHYVDTLDSTDVVKVVTDVAYIGDVAPVFIVLAQTQVSRMAQLLAFKIVVRVRNISGSGNDWGFNSDPTSQKGKVAHPYFDSSYGAFVANVGRQPYGLYGSFVNGGSDNSTGAYSICYGCSVGTGKGIVLDFENSKVHLPAIEQARGVFSLELDSGGGWMVLYFENSAFRLSSVEKDLGRPVVLDDGVWFRSSAVNGPFHDDRYDCLFRQSGSVAAQGESTSSTFRGKEGRTEVISSLQKDDVTIETRPSFHRDLENKNVGFREFLHKDRFPYCFVEQNTKRSNSLHRHVSSHVIDRHLPLHGTATQIEGSNIISNEDGFPYYFAEQKRK